MTALFSIKKDANYAFARRAVTIRMDHMELKVVMLAVNGVFGRSVHVELQRVEETLRPGFESLDEAATSQSTAKCIS